MASILFNDQEMKKVFNPVSMEILTLIDTNPGINSNEIQKKTDRQYAYIIKTVKHLHKEGLIRSVKKERSKELYLTNEGSLVADKLIESIDAVNSL